MENLAFYQCYTPACTYPTQCGIQCAQNSGRLKSNEICEVAEQYDYRRLVTRSNHVPSISNDDQILCLL